MALPLLDAMVPAGTALAKALPAKRRLIAMEMVHGAAGSTAFGAEAAPVGAGRGRVGASTSRPRRWRRSSPTATT